MYGGALFEEDPYEDWFLDDRDMLKNRYLGLLSKIIQLYEQKEEWKTCIEYAETYLLIDKYAEPIYCALMRCHAYLGETSRIVTTFEQCTDSVTVDLACPLSDTTISLFHSLTGKGIV